MSLLASLRNLQIFSPRRRRLHPKTINRARTEQCLSVLEEAERKDGKNVQGSHSASSEEARTVSLGDSGQ